MSIRWSPKIGYGFEVDTNLLEKNLGMDHDLSQDFEDMSTLYPLLEVAYSGNHMDSNDTVKTWVFLKSTYTEFRYDGEWEKTLPSDMFDISKYEDEMAELWKFVEDTGIAIGPIQWKLLLSVG